jgi:hypothetical protein
VVKKEKTMRTVLQLVQMAWAASGNKGSLTRRFIESWRKAHPAYAKAKLSTRFGNGSAIPVQGPTKLDRATAAWLKAGNPSPSSPEFDRAAFNDHVANFIDEYEEAFYR